MTDEQYYYEKRRQTFYVSVVMLCITAIAIILLVIFAPAIDRMLDKGDEVAEAKDEPSAMEVPEEELCVAESPEESEEQLQDGVALELSFDLPEEEELPDEPEPQVDERQEQIDEFEGFLEALAEHFGGLHKYATTH